MAEPMELPTSLIVPVTPLVAGREVDLDLDLDLPALLALDLERCELRAFDERLELDAARVRVGARRAVLRARDGELPLLRVVPAELPLRRVFVWAMMTPPPSVLCTSSTDHTLPWVWSNLPLHRAFESSLRLA